MQTRASRIPSLTFSAKLIYVVIYQSKNDFKFMKIKDKNETDATPLAAIPL